MIKRSLLVAFLSAQLYVPVFAETPPPLPPREVAPPLPPREVDGGKIEAFKNSFRAANAQCKKDQDDVRLAFSEAKDRVSKSKIKSFFAKKPDFKLIEKQIGMFVNNTSQTFVEINSEKPTNSRLVILQAKVDGLKKSCTEYKQKIMEKLTK